MTHWRIDPGLWLALAGLLALMIAGCSKTDPSGPQIEVTNNSGSVVIVVPTDDSVGSTAPCGGVTTEQQNGPVTPDCSSTVTPAPVVVTP